MLYSFLRSLFRLAVRLFFYKVEVNGLENAPRKGPLIIVANHPASFLDPIVIAVKLKVRVYFLAKAVVFKNKFVNRILAALNMIPIYRAQDNPEMLEKNEETFKACFEHLEQGGALLIFPEGISQTVRKLLTIKTGAARIALGAENRNQFQLDTKILPIGLNYSNQEQFQSKLFVSIGEPIQVGKYREKYALDDVESVRELSAEIEEQLNNQMINAGEERMDLLVKRIERLMKGQILKDWGLPSSHLKGDHQATKRISEAVKYFAERDPQRVSRMERHITQYFDRVQEVNLPESIFKSKPLTFGSTLQYLTYFILGLPFFLFGFLNNFIPYILSRTTARKGSQLKEYRGAIGLASGTLIFLIFYIAYFFIALEISSEVWISLVYIFLVPPIGVFSYYYWKKFKRFYYKVVFAKSKNKTLLVFLLQKRNYILRELEMARVDFERYVEEQA